jgi:aldehyde:ferredoxin oxidoreductase
MYNLDRVLLRVDLTNRRYETEKLRESLARNLIGGRGINSRLLYDLVDQNVEPLSPANPLIIGTGPLTGTNVPTSARFTITAKSPLTGILGDSNCGGHWAPFLRRAGFDFVVVEGESEKPCYILVNDRQVEIREASHLWGRHTEETQRLIEEETSAKVHSICIGQAGENRVRYAAVMNGLKNAAGRTGMGAVMGAKKLKAIAVVGTQPVKVAHPELLKQLVRDAAEKILKMHSYNAMSVMGTPMLVEALNSIGAFATRNWKEDCYEEAIRIGWTALQKYVKKSRACYACPIHCGHYYEISEGKYAGTYGEGPEFATLSAFGGRCANPDLESILVMNQMANRFGLDTISTGNTLAWTMECYERGYLRRSDLDGIEATWGNAEAMIALIEKIARREGVGDLLAEGSYLAAKKLGKGMDAVVHAKGMTLSAGMTRVSKGVTFATAVASRGGDHLRGIPNIEQMGLPPEFGQRFIGEPGVVNQLGVDGKAKMVVWLEHSNAVSDSLELCKFAGPWIQLDNAYMPEDYAKLFHAVTGVEMAGDQMMRIGERIINIERLFNLREGITREDDSVVSRLLDEPSPSGPFKGEHLTRAEFTRMLDEYYELRGWSKEGIPPNPEVILSLE